MKDALRIKQCEANCIALFRHYELLVPLTIATLTDRTMFHAGKRWIDRLSKLVPERFENWPFNRNHGTTAIGGWRERVATYSMQIVLHESSVIEVDFDISNPNYGLALAVGHLAEVLKHSLWHTKTDSFSILKGLRKRGIAVPDIREMEVSA